MTILGYENTLSVTIDEMLHHTKAARRGVKHALLVADMPYGSYHVSPDDAIRNAARFIKEAGAEAVKIEGGEKRAELIRRIIDAEIPVTGHIGLTPQSVNVMGGYKVQGKSLAAVEQLMRDAVALDRAGVACIYLEGIPREVAAMITAEVAAPTIGIGAGPDCDGQVLVYHDLLNLTFTPPAKFVRRYGDAAELISHAAQAFRADVLSRQYPSDDESYHLPKETQAALETVLERKRAMLSSSARRVVSPSLSLKGTTNPRSARASPSRPGVPSARHAAMLRSNNRRLSSCSCRDHLDEPTLTEAHRGLPD